MRSWKGSECVVIYRGSSRDSGQGTDSGASLLWTLAVWLDADSLSEPVFPLLKSTWEKILLHVIFVKTRTVVNMWELMVFIIFLKHKFESCVSWDLTYNSLSVDLRDRLLQISEERMNILIMCWDHWWPPWEWNENRALLPYFYIKKINLDRNKGLNMKSKILNFLEEKHMRISLWS